MYNIVDFGAKPDGTLCTRQIQKAIDACFLAGGGEVAIPEGVFLTGCVRLRSNVTLHLLKNAMLKGSANPEDYFDYLRDEIEPITEQERASKVSTALPDSNGRSVFPYSRWNNAIIRAIRAENIAIVGEENSVIDGQNCFDEQGEEEYRGPHGINMWYCSHVRFCGYTLQNTGNWAHAIQNSRDIEVRNIKVLGGHDGFDVRTCDDVSILDSAFFTGDDAVAGFDNIKVRIKNCVLNSSCSALRFGGHDVVVENCAVSAPNRYGFRGALSQEEKKKRMETNSDNSRFNCLNVFLYYCDNRAYIRKTPGNIVVKNCRFTNVDSVFSHPFGAKWTCNRPLHDITFENCAFDGVSDSISIDSDENEPLVFKMKDCKITARSGAEKNLFMGANHFKSIQFENVEINGYHNPEIVYSSEGEIRLIHTPGLTARRGEKSVRGAQ